MSPENKAKQRIHTGYPGEASGYYFDVQEVLFDQQTDFQRVQVFQTRDWGRVLLHDNEVMWTEWDGFVYPEMIMHPALTSHAAPRSVGIIGGGDGGSVTEACRHPDLTDITLCEIDEQVVTASREFFPELAVGLNDPRVTCAFEDGNAWLDDKSGRFDVLAVDGTDPVGPGVVLFEDAFYQKCKAALKPGGIFVQQIESPFYSIRPSEMTFDLRIEDIVARARAVFAQAHVYLATIPTYIGAQWAFLYAGDDNLPLQARDERWQAYAGQTQYYSPEMQAAAFALPPFLRRLIEAN
jgi:spermidine synthase